MTQVDETHWRRIIGGKSLESNELVGLKLIHWISNGSDSLDSMDSKGLGSTQLNQLDSLDSLEANHPRAPYSRRLMAIANSEARRAICKESVHFVHVLNTHTL